MCFCCYVLLYLGAPGDPVPQCSVTNMEEGGESESVARGECVDREKKFAKRCK